MWQGEWVKKTPLPSTHSPNHGTARHLAEPAVDCGPSEGALAECGGCSDLQVFLVAQRSARYFLLVRGVHQWPESFVSVS
jgi:hypothetical protein